MRTFMAEMLIGLAITTVAAFGADNSLGTWQLNVEKSKFSPPPLALKSLNVVREAADGGVKATITGERTDGTPVNASFTAKYDGTTSTLAGTGTPYDTIAIKQVNANTFTDERKKTGTPYHSTGHTVISKDGKTMTVTVKGTDATGKPLMTTLVFEKQ